jgi:hypothetical protein
MFNSTHLSLANDDYFDTNLSDPVSVVLNNRVFVFAREAGVVTQTIYYRVRQEKVGVVGIFDEWSDWRALNLDETADNAIVPPLLRVIGMDLITAPPVAVTSSPADAAFSVVVDAKYICVFRLSTRGTLLLNRFVVVEQPNEQSSQDETKNIYPTILLDPAWEVRYARSKKKDTPASPKDTLGYRDMDSQPFIEPTMEVATINNITTGNFSVVLLPTSKVEVGRWTFFIVKADLTAVDVYSYQQSSDGLLDFDLDPQTTFSITPTLVDTTSGNVTTACTGGVTAAVFYDREASSDQSSQIKTFKRAGRLMLTLPVGDLSSGIKAGTCIYDFSIRHNGTIASFNGSASPVIDGSLTGGTYTASQAPSSLQYPVPDTAVFSYDEVSVNSVALGQVSPSSSPTLLDSADGLVHCYYAGQPDALGAKKFLVAQYSPLTTRYFIDQSWAAGSQNGLVRFVAARAGSSMNSMTNVISGSIDGLCDLAINYGSATGIPAESWSGLPRKLEAFVAVLNGDSSADPCNPDVRSGALPFFDFTGTRYIARLSLGTTTAQSGYIDLVSKRTDLRLKSTAVTAGTTSGQVDLAIEFSSTAGVATMTWQGLPNAAMPMVNILRGSASGSTYRYTPASSDTKLYGIATTGGTILLLSTTTLTIEVVISSTASASCDVNVTPSGGSAFTVSNVPRRQSDFISTLMANSSASAVFSYASPDPVSGEVLAQPGQSATDLRAGNILFEPVMDLDNADVVVASTNTAALLNGHTFNPSSLIDKNQLLAASAIAISTPTNGADGIMANGNGAASDNATNGAWQWRETPQAVAFNAQNAIAIALSGANSSVLNPGRGFTIESWVNPSSGSAARIASFNQGEASTPGGVVPSYMLGTTGKPSILFDLATSTAAFQGSQVSVASNAIFIPSSAFTYECWVNPSTNPAPTGYIGSVFSIQLLSDPSAPLLMMGLNTSSDLVFGYSDNTQQFQTVATSGHSLSSSVWQHLAITGLKTHSVWTITLYLNATNISQTTGLSFNETTEAPIFYIGTSAINNRTMAGSFNEMRFWQSCRNSVEIARSMQMSLSGNEPSLAGYWPLIETPTNGAVMTNNCTATGTALNGSMHVATTQPVSASIDGVFLSLLAGIGGGDAVIGHGFLRSGDWNHVAATYQSGTAVYFDNVTVQSNNTAPVFAVCGTSNTLNISVAGSLEGHIYLPSLNNLDNVILSKWGSDNDDASYRLYVNTDSKLTMSLMLLIPNYKNGSVTQIESYTAMEYTVTATDALTVNTPYHVFGTFKNETQTDDSNNNVSGRGVLSLYINGQAAGSTQTPWYRNAIIAVNSSTTNFCIGMQSYISDSTPNTTIESQWYFNGVLTGIRVWSEAMDQPHIVAAMKNANAQEEEAGVISAWWFDEQTGKEAIDKVSGNNAILSRSNLWVLYAPLSTTTCFVNGYQVGLYTAATAAQSEGYLGTSTQFTVGAYIEPANTYNLGISGSVQALRVWSVAKSMIELSSSRNSLLSGEENNLSGFWSFNGDAKDGTQYGNNGTLVGSSIPTFSASNAPLSNEAPPVLNIFSHHITAFQEDIDCTPAVCEYADAQLTTDNSLISVMQRAYIYDNESIAIVPNFKVGELDLVYIGQVQTNPALIGFIEGAPPVPSENLSRPYYNSAYGYNNYFDASSIALTESANVEYQFSYSDFNTTQLQNFRSSFGVFGKWNIGTNQGSPFFSVTDDKFTNTFKIGAKIAVDHLEAQTEDQVVSTGLSTVKTNQLGLRGDWETAEANQDDYLNPQVGRRFLPANKGYALVVSLTADLYGMQIKSTGEMVGKVIVPNEDIPPDENIITFNINPRYIKNGTLDGKVGLENDPDWPNSDTTRGSYFNAKEAYVLKAKIERETQQKSLFYEQFDASGRGRAKNTDLTSAKGMQAYDFDNDVARQSLVNNYVWSADGGLYKEETQAMASQTLSFGGVYRLNYAAGPSFETELAFYVGVYAGVDSLFGSQIDITVKKSRSESQSFGMTASVTADPMLKAWDPTANDSEGGYMAALCPGKVNAYRFMSYYLAPTTDNSAAFINDVIDEDWYKYSDDPNAIALRSADIKSNKAWRILYRTTYVSRVPPAFNNAVDQTVGESVTRAISIEDNQLLITLVQTELGTSPPTKVNIGTAVTAVLQPSSGTSPLSGYLPWWQAFVTSTDAAAIAEFNQLNSDILSFFVAGYKNGQLPV